VIIFFPSFFEATQYKNRIKCDVPIFLDEVGFHLSPSGMNSSGWGESGKKAVLISYMWGTLTEGVDYKNGRGRTVVIVGVGYPALNDRTRAVESAYDSEFGHGWEYAIEIPTIRKVRQALGRVVRSPDDYGARVLLDGVIRLYQRSVMVNIPSLNFSQKKKAPRSLMLSLSASSIHL